VDRYIDHHRDSGRLPADPGLENKFHFWIQNRAVSKDCFRTDDRRIFTSIEKAYLFEHVDRAVTTFDTTTASQPAVAGASVSRALTYAGLSAELAYTPENAPICFGFDAPRPTYATSIWRSASNWGWDGYVAELSQSWRPKTTTIVIRRIPGKIIDRFSINWSKMIANR
jgi:hypothetical protein